MKPTKNKFHCPACQHSKMLFTSCYISGSWFFLKIVCAGDSFSTMPTRLRPKLGSGLSGLIIARLVVVGMLHRGRIHPPIILW
jgi:hypothetical protein